MKRIVTILAFISAMCLLVACHTSKAFTYKVTTGDMIQISIDSSDGFDLTSELPFAVKKDGVVLSQGMFIQGEAYEQYADVAKNVEILLSEGANNDVEYLFYEYEGREYNYVIKVKNSNTAIVLGNAHSKEEAEECFKHLTFKLQK